MRLIWRPLAPREIDHEFIWLCVSLGGLAAAALWMKLGLSWPFCIFHALTGHPCLTCGATRSAIAFFHGDFAGAFVWNPMVFAIYLLLTVYDVYAFIVVVLRRPRLRLVGISSFHKRLARWAVLTIIVVNWGYLLLNSRRFG
ncbi:MAG TPA: DUF2752 domain-containing protein [Verrucomicrobiaceae bacterium]|jgi:hypothetical protein